MRIWHWLKNTLNISYPIHDYTDIQSNCRATGLGQCKIITVVDIIFTFNAIWLTRNKVIFQNISINYSSTISNILASISLAGNTSSVISFVNMRDFVILKRFKVIIQSPKTLNIIEVNCDGASLSTSSNSVCGDIVRDSDGGFMGAFASFLAVSNSLIAKLYDALFAIE